MEEDLGDEDVELENSPLDLYLRECESDRIKELRGKPKTKQFFIWNVMSNLHDKITNIRFTSKLNVLKRFFGYEESLVAFDDAYRLRCRNSIRNCSVLLEDDADFLENVTNDEPSGILVNETQMFSSKILLFAVGIGCLKLPPEWNDLLFEISSTFGAILVADSVFCIFKLLKRKCDVRKSVAANENFVKSCEELIRSGNKCVMYIKELEIYGRGLLLPVPEFSLARVENSSLFVSNSLNVPKMCLLNSLRVRLFEELKIGILESRSALIQIIKQYPLSSREIDHQQNYIAFFKSTELAALLNTSSQSEEISSSSLKSLFQLLHLHLSELLRRWCLCFCSVSPSSSLKNVFDLFIISEAILKPFAEALNWSTRRLNDSYKLHSYFSSSWKKEYQTKRETKQINSTGQALNSSLKGLSLHFLSSLARIQEIVEALDSMQSESSEDNEDDYSVISNHLQLIQQDVKAGQFCLNQSVARLLTLRGKPGEEEEPAEILKVPNIPSDPSVPVIPMSESVDVASADQVFEGYVDSNEKNEEEGDNYYDEEVDKIAVKQREISKTMFAELKQVLIPKAKERRVREAKALGLTENEAQEKMMLEEEKESNQFETEDVVKVKKERKRIIYEDVDFVSENNGSDSSSPTNVYFRREETNFPNSLMAAVASLAANRARNNFLQEEDECFESED